MSGFVVVRHPDIAVPGVVPVAALEYQRLRGWVRVSDVRAEPADFHLPEFFDAPDLDAAPDVPDPIDPEPTEPTEPDDEDPAEPDEDEETSA